MQELFLRVNGPRMLTKQRKFLVSNAEFYLKGGAHLMRFET
jgi:hypothetical protein